MAFFLKDGPMGDFNERGQAGSRGHFRIASLELKLAERERRAEEPLVIRQAAEKRGASLAASHRRMNLSKAVLSSNTSPEVLCN